MKHFWYGFLAVAAAAFAVEVHRDVERINKPDELGAAMEAYRAEVARFHEEADKWQELSQ